MVKTYSYGYIKDDIKMYCCYQILFYVFKMTWTFINYIVSLLSLIGGRPHDYTIVLSNIKRILLCLYC